MNDVSRWVSVSKHRGKGTGSGSRRRCGRSTRRLSLTGRAADGLCRRSHLSEAFVYRIDRLTRSDPVRSGTISASVDATS